MATPEAATAYLEAIELPIWSDEGFWFACPDDSGTAKEVRLFTDVARPDRVVSMERQPGGIFTLRFPAPEVDRLEYSFQVIDAEGHLHWKLDPGNPRQVDSPFGPKSEAVSGTYRVPDYVCAGGTASEAPRGSIREIPIPGPRGRVRTTWMWHPEGYHREDALPILIFLDGGDYLRYSGAQSMLAELVHSGRLAPCRAAFIPPNLDRFREYSASPRTSAWLASILPRALARHVRVPRRGERRIGVGASLGGLALLQGHFGHPGLFGGLVLQSGSFFQRETDEMVSAFAHFGRICRFVRSVRGNRAAAPSIPVRMTCGLAEENLVNNRAMARALVSLGLDATLTENRDAHNWIGWRDSLGAELVSLLPGPNA